MRLALVRRSAPHGAAECQTKKRAVLFGTARYIEYSVSHPQQRGAALLLLQQEIHAVVQNLLLALGQHTSVSMISQEKTRTAFSPVRSHLHLGCLILFFPKLLGVVVQTLAGLLLAEVLHLTEQDFFFCRVQRIAPIRLGAVAFAER